MQTTTAITTPRPTPGFWRALPLAIGISSGLWGMGFAVAEAIAHNL